jgi:hypothetical protein
MFNSRKDRKEKPQSSQNNMIYINSLRFLRFNLASFA